MIEFTLHIVISLFIFYPTLSPATEFDPKSHHHRFWHPMNSNGEKLPTVVLLHGSSGKISFHDTWADRFTDWGYNAYIPDFYRPHGFFPGHDSRPASNQLVDWQIEDMKGVHEFLIKHPRVDPTKIVIVGWSLGGASALATVHGNWLNSTLPKETRFKAVFAFYPAGCVGGKDTVSSMVNNPKFNVPVMMVGGDADRLFKCWINGGFERAKDNGSDVVMKVYKGAHHAFDSRRWEYEPKIVNRPNGVVDVYKFHKEGFEDALKELKRFLGINLSKK